MDELMNKICKKTSRTSFPLIKSKKARLLREGRAKFEKYVNTIKHLIEPALQDGTFKFSDQRVEEMEKQFKNHNISVHNFS